MQVSPSTPAFSRSRPALLLVLVAIIVATAGASSQAFDASFGTRDDDSAIRFVSSDHSVCLRSDFPSGRVNECIEISPNEFDLVIRPEQEPINDSAWYAFHIRSTKPTLVTIRLRYQEGTHRYDPRISYDGHTWRSASHMVTRRHPAGTQVVLQMRVGPTPLWVSAQERLTNREVDDWMNELARSSFVRQEVIGKSVLGRPIRKLEITESKSPAYIFLMGRQHPPEVSGTIGMMRFVEAIAADTRLAHQFRKKFCAVVVPTANPDGVDRGHWRCNASGIDLNRDWGPFTQPETKAISRQLLKYRSLGPHSLYLVLDFHATYEDVFYTAADVDDAFPQGFTSAWLSALQYRFPWYNVLHDATHNENRTTSKTWVRETLNVASITYEFGDNSDREQIAELARGNAEEMMRLLLQRQREYPLVTRLLVKSADR